MAGLQPCALKLRDHADLAQPTLSLRDQGGELHVAVDIYEGPVDVATLTAD